MDHHRVVIRNTTDSPIGANATIEVDGKPLTCVDEVVVRIDAQGLTTVTLTIPAAVDAELPALVAAGIDLVQPDVAEAKRVELKPGDTVVLETGEPWDRKTCERAREYLRVAFPENEVAVVTGGTLRVATRDREITPGLIAEAQHRLLRNSTTGLA